MKHFPAITTNRNVPARTCLVCELSQCSGEIVTTTFFDVIGVLWQVTDWSGDKPHKVDPLDIAREMELNPIELYRAVVQRFAMP